MSEDAPTLAEVRAYVRDHIKEFSKEEIRHALLEHGAKSQDIDRAFSETAQARKKRVWRAALGGFAGLAGLAMIVASWQVLHGPRGQAPVAPPAAAPAPTPGALQAEELRKAREAFRSDFFSAASHVRLSEALYQSGRLVDSFYVLEAARRFFPEEEFKRAQIDIIVLKGHLSWSPGPGVKDKAAAIRLADQASDADPQNLSPVHFKASILAGDNDLKAAVPLYTRVAMRDPDSAEGRASIQVLGSIASMPEVSGPVQAAADALARIAERHPQNAEAYVRVMVASWSHGGLDQVRSNNAQVLANAPDHGGAAIVQGMLSIQDRKIPDAIKWFKKGLASDPENQIALEKLAGLYYREMRDLDAALPYYIGLHHADPDYNDGEFAEFRISKGLGDRRAAADKAATTPEAVLGLLASEDGAMRAEGAVLAAGMKDPRLIPALGSLLDDDVSNVVQNADYALHKLGSKDPASVAALRDELLRSPKTFARGKSLGTFAELFPAEVIAAALAGIKDPEPFVRFSARMVLKAAAASEPKARAALKEYEKTEKDRTLLKIYPWADAHAEAGAKEAKRMAKAMKDIEAEQKDPVHIHWLAGSEASIAKNYKLAVKEFEAALAANRRSKSVKGEELARIHMFTGDAYLNSGNGAKAETYYRLALKEIKKEFDLRYNFVCALSMQGKGKQAANAFKDCLRMAAGPEHLSKIKEKARTDSRLEAMRRTVEYRKLMEAPAKASAE